MIHLLCSWDFFSGGEVVEGQGDRSIISLFFAENAGRG